MNSIFLCIGARVEKVPSKNTERSTCRILVTMICTFLFFHGEVQASAIARTKCVEYAELERAIDGSNSGRVAVRAQLQIVDQTKPKSKLVIDALFVRAHEVMARSTGPSHIGPELSLVNDSQTMRYETLSGQNVWVSSPATAPFSEQWNLFLRVADYACKHHSASHDGKTLVFRRAIFSDDSTQVHLKVDATVEVSVHRSVPLLFSRPRETDICGTAGSNGLISHRYQRCPEGGFTPAK